MDSGGNKNENKLNKAGKTVLYTFILLVFMSAVSSGSSGFIGVLAVLSIVIGVAVLLFYFGKKAALKKQREDKAEGYQNPYSRSGSAQPRSYNEAEARYQDGLRRMQQLDSFLENGIIDKKEYQVLKEKYRRQMESL